MHRNGFQIDALQSAVAGHRKTATCWWHERRTFTKWARDVRRWHTECAEIESQIRLGCCPAQLPNSHFHSQVPDTKCSPNRCSCMQINTSTSRAATQQQSLNIISATLQLQFSSSSSSSKRAQPCELQSWSVFTDNWHGNGSEELTRWQDKQ